MKILKGLFIVISIICIAFTGFFAYSYISGHTAPLAILGHQISKLAGKPATTTNTATVNKLTNEYGLSTSQANKVVELASSLGVDTSDSAAVDAFIAKNSDKLDDAEALANAVKAGKMSEAEAYARLAEMLDV